MAINVDNQGSRGGITLDSGSTTVRQSPRTDFGTQVRNGVSAGAGTAGAAIGVAAPFVPGAAVVSAAVTGAAGGISSGGGSPAYGGSGVGSNVGPDGIPMGGPGLSSNGAGGAGGAQGGGSQQDLLNQTKDMQEMMASFNLQYLQLQEKMQMENRSFSTVSNVMKTKHDTAKSSISNVR
jgi:hypothetical protein